MAVTATPVFSQAPLLSSVRVTAANTSSQGGGTIGTDIWLSGTAGANGAFIERVRFSPTATTPTTTTATVGRVFYSSVTSGATTNANTFLLGEITLPAIAADNATNSAPTFDLPLNITIPAGNTILVTNHAAPATNTAWVGMTIGSNL
jgi:hypothetical protein